METGDRRCRSLSDVHSCARRPLFGRPLCRPFLLHRSRGRVCHRPFRAAHPSRVRAAASRANSDPPAGRPGFCVPPGCCRIPPNRHLHLGCRTPLEEVHVARPSWGRRRPREWAGLPDCVHGAPFWRCWAGPHRCPGGAVVQRPGAGTPVQLSARIAGCRSEVPQGREARLQERDDASPRWWPAVSGSPGSSSTRRRRRRSPSGGNPRRRGVGGSRRPLWRSPDSPFRIRTRGRRCTRSGGGLRRCRARKEPKKVRRCRLLWRRPTLRRARRGWRA